MNLFSCWKLWRIFLKKKKIPKNAIVEYLTELSRDERGLERHNPPIDIPEYNIGFRDGQREIAKNLLAAFTLKAVTKQILKRRYGFSWENFKFEKEK